MVFRIQPQADHPVPHLRDGEDPLGAVEVQPVGGPRDVGGRALGEKDVPADVVEIHPATWIQENDRIAVALQSPLALGCAQAGIDVIRDEAAKRSSATMTAAADRLDHELEACRTEAYAAMEENADLERGLKARSAAI
jgi:outer membrane murein-binding lipoprotein Lpp